MKGFTTELKVGLFALIVLLILAYMTFKVSGTEWLRREGYNVYVYFSNIAGLDEKTKIKVAGVDAGVIEKITLEGGRAKLRIRVYPEIKLYRDATASIKASGLLGDKYLDIGPGSEKPELKEGETIRMVREPIDVDEMIYRLVSISDSFKVLTENLNDILGSEETKKALRETANNLARITENLNASITSNDLRLKETLSGIDKLTASVNRLIDENSSGVSDTVNNLRDVSSSLKTGVPELVSDLRDASYELKTLLQENRPKILQLTEKADKAMSSVQRVAEKIEKGEGTLGKLVTDERLYDSVNKAATRSEEHTSELQSH